VTTLLICIQCRQCLLQYFFVQCFDLLTLKVESESRVTWATSVPILVFLGLSVLDLGPVYATDVRQTSNRCQTDRRQTASSLYAPPIRGWAYTRYSHIINCRLRCNQHISRDMFEAAFPRPEVFEAKASGLQGQGQGEGQRPRGQDRGQ